MKYEIVGIQHMVGDFTPTDGANAGHVQHYDMYRLHTLKDNSKVVGGKECVVIRTTTEQMENLAADFGVDIDDMVNSVVDMHTRVGYGKTNLVDWVVSN